MSQSHHCYCSTLVSAQPGFPLKIFERKNLFLACWLALLELLLGGSDSSGWLDVNNVLQCRRGRTQVWACLMMLFTEQVEVEKLFLTELGVTG